MLNETKNGCKKINRSDGDIRQTILDQVEKCRIIAKIEEGTNGFRTWKQTLWNKQKNSHPLITMEERKVNEIRKALDHEIEEIKDKIPKEFKQEEPLVILEELKDHSQKINNQINPSLHPHLLKISQSHLETHGNGGWEENKPHAKSGGTFTSCGNLLVCFGGRFHVDDSKSVSKTMLLHSKTGHYYSNQVYALNISYGDWSMPRCIGPWPKGRIDHTAVFVEPESLYIFGGRGQGGIIFHDFYRLKISTWEWSTINTLDGPPGRYWHASASDGNSVYLFGGRNLDETIGDLWEFDVIQYNRMRDKNPASISSKRLWEKPNTLGYAPTPRFGCTLLALDNERIILSGGWEPIPSLPVDKNIDIYILDTVTMIWSRPRMTGYFVSNYIPTNRILAQTFIYNNNLIVYGGFDFELGPAGETIPESITPIKDPYVYYFDLTSLFWRRKTVKSLAFCHYGSGNNILENRYYTLENRSKARNFAVVVITCDELPTEIHIT